MWKTQEQSGNTFVCQTAIRTQSYCILSWIWLPGRREAGVNTNTAQSILPAHSSWPRFTLSNRWYFWSPNSRTANKAVCPRRERRRGVREASIRASEVQLPSPGWHLESLQRRSLPTPATFGINLLRADTALFYFHVVMARSLTLHLTNSLLMFFFLHFQSLLLSSSSPFLFTAF